jgi:uncharacterized membrane protein HdeD (DUF308 family)
MAESLVGGIRRTSGWSIAMGVLIILLGIIALMAPMASGVVAVAILGWTAIFGGFAQIFFAFHAHSGGRRILEIVLGVVYLAVGVYLISHPVAGLLTLTLLLGWMLLGYGILAVVLAARMRPDRGWGWVLFDAIVTIIVGIMILEHWPLNSAWVIGTLFGLSILFRGISRLIVSLAVRKVTSALA